MLDPKRCDGCRLGEATDRARHIAHRRERSLERDFQTRTIVDPLEGDLVAGGPQLAREEVGVIGRVFDEEGAKRLQGAHFGGVLGGISLSTSQYRPISRAASMKREKSTGFRM